MARVNRRKALALYLLLVRRRKARTRRYWVHPVNQYRKQYGAYYHLLPQLVAFEEKHINYFRMSAEKMDHLLSLVGPDLAKKSSNFREPIEPKQRLAVTLRFLATGEHFQSLAYQYRLGRSTVAQSVHMTCRAIERRLKAEMFPMPTEDMWTNVASGFWTKWNFPNCIGSLDGKHVTITSPAKSGSLYFNYKKTFSIVLLALVDADYRLINVQIGDYGRSSDGGTYKLSELGRGMEANSLNVPAARPLPGFDQRGPVPFTMVGDAAFPLKTYLMRPFPGDNLPKWREIFNYRLSRARMSVECSFGILSSRFRVLYTRMTMTPENANSVIMAACILHNYLLDARENTRVLEQAVEEGLPALPDPGGRGPNRANQEAYAVREKFAAFFNSPEGSVAWQDNRV